MDISLLKTFLEVARTRHFGKAADRLFVTQSAVSARIKLLESNLGVNLFNRRRNDIQLTPAGMRLVRHAETIVRGWERARNEIALEGEGAETLAVGTSIDLWGILLREWAVALRRSSPHLVLQLEVQPAEILVNRLVSGLLDLALLFEPPQLPDLAIKQVADVRLILVSTQPNCSLEAALALDYYMVDWGNLFTRSCFEQLPLMAPPAARLGSGVLALDLMLSRGGSAYLAEPLVQAQLDQGLLYRVADAPVIERTAFAVYRPGDEQRSELMLGLSALKAIAQFRQSS